MDSRVCVYCGDFWQCRDHLVPLAWEQTFRDYKRGATVLCCSMCNRLAGDFVAFDIATKAEYIARRYRVRYKKILKQPRWTEEELKTLDYALRRFVMQKLFLKELITQKLWNLDLVAVGYTAEEIQHLNDFEDETVRVADELVFKG